MKFFIDCEFHERGPGHPIELISIGVVTEDDHRLHLINSDYNWTTASEWLIRHVKPALSISRDMDASVSFIHIAGPLRGTYGYPNDRSLPFKQIGPEILRFVNQHRGDNPPEFWGEYCAYDWVVLCQTFGSMSDLPSGWPMVCCDIQQVVATLPPKHAAALKAKPGWKQDENTEHNALMDAIHAKQRSIVLKDYFLQRTSGGLQIITHWEVRYEDRKGRYTEEYFSSLLAAERRMNELDRDGIEAEVYEVTK